MTSRLVLHVVYAIFGLATSGISGINTAPKTPGNELSANVMNVLQNADRFEVYSLDPEVRSLPATSSVAFHGFKILGKTVLKNPGERTSVVASLESGIRDSPGIPASCFNPRHGIRATMGSKTTDLVICFECAHVQVFYLGQEDKGVMVLGAAQRLFDRILRDAKVPFPKAMTDGITADTTVSRSDGRRPTLDLDALTSLSKVDVNQTDAIVKHISFPENCDEGC